VITRVHAFLPLYRYKNRYVVRPGKSDQLAACNETIGTGTVAGPGLPFFICRSISRGHGREIALLTSRAYACGNAFEDGMLPLAVAVNGDESFTRVDELAAILTWA
jgi:hypothetical protein